MMLGFIQIIAVVLLAVTVKETKGLSPLEKKEIYFPEEEQKKKDNID